MNKFWLESWGWFLAIWGASSWNSLLVAGRKSKNKENKSNPNKKQTESKYQGDLRQRLMHAWLEWDSMAICDCSRQFKWSFPALVFHDGFLGGIIVCKKNSALWSGILLTISKKCKRFLGVQKLVLEIQSLWILDEITSSHAVWVRTPQR